MAVVLITDVNGNPATSTGTPTALAAVIAAAFVAGTPLRVEYRN